MGKVILVTGISTGFGKHISTLLAGKEYIVYGTVRDDQVTDGRVNCIRMDLTDLETIRNGVNTIISQEGKIDVLINNGAMHSGGPLETVPLSNIRLQMETNFMGLANLTREVLPHMREKESGTIINISSIGGLMGLPFQAFYSAAKFAVEGFSEALRMEVKQFNIKVIVINPGDFHTNNTLNRRKFLPSPEDTDQYRDQFLKTLRVIEKDENNGWHPDILANKILKILKTKNPRQRYIVGSLDQKLAVYLKSFLPEKIFRKILEDHYKIS
jgi:short-subunit dehydrogenase